jgi:hypothetical protein
MLPRLVFHYRFGGILPPGVSRTTNVISISWPPPPGVPQTYSRQIRESLGGYYGNLRSYSAVSWKQVPKALDDVLDEYGARVQDGKLVDADGRIICIMKKPRGGSRWDANRREWEDRRRKLLEEQFTVLVVDVEEDE